MRHDDEEKEIMYSYKLFMGWMYYPHGGYDDFKGNFGSNEEAIDWAEKNSTKDMDYWAHIVFEDEIVMRGVLDISFIKSSKWKWEEVP